jgi:hypothetical protein
MSWPRNRDLKHLDDVYFDAIGNYMNLHDEVLGALCKHQATYLDKRFRFTRPTGNPNRTYKVVNVDTHSLQPIDEKDFWTGPPFDHTSEFLGIRGNGSFHIYPLNEITFDLPCNGGDALDTQILELEYNLHKNWSEQIMEIEENAPQRLKSLYGREVDFIRKTAGNWAKNMEQNVFRGMVYCPYDHGMHLFLENDKEFVSLENPTLIKHIWS